MTASSKVPIFWQITDQTPGRPKRDLEAEKEVRARIWVKAERERSPYQNTSQAEGEENTHQSRSKPREKEVFATIRVEANRKRSPCQNRGQSRQRKESLPE